MSMRQAILAALRGDAAILPTIAETLRQRIEVREEGALPTVVKAAGALEPIIAGAVKRNPSRLGTFGLKSAHLLASLATEDSASNQRLAAIAKNSSVGIVFVDVAGFTRYTADKGDDAAIGLLNKLNVLVERAARHGKGEIVKSLGDGYLLAFPSASQAVRGAISLHQDALEMHRNDPEFSLHLRIAVHSGEPLVEGDDLLGHDVNLTARLLDDCRPDEICVSEAAKELAERRLKKVAFSKKRKVKIRGLSTKVTVFSVHPIEARQRALKVG